MDLNLIYALLIASVPVIFALLFAKRYNIVHGFVTFLLTSYLLLLAVSKLQNHIPVEITNILYGKDGYFGLLMFYKGFYEVAAVSLNLAGLTDLLVPPYGEYVILAPYVVLFIVSHIISAIIRRHRVNSIKALRRQVKRY
jgi:hypothetical protein